MMGRPSDAATTASAIARIQDGQQVSRAEIASAFLPILRAEFTGADVAWGALFGALHTRGPVPEEVLGLVDAILAFDPALASSSPARSTCLRSAQLSPSPAVARRPSRPST